MIKKKDMNLLIKSSINVDQPEIYRLLVDHWNPSSGGLAIDSIPWSRKGRQHLKLLKDTYNQIVSKYVYSQWKILSYFCDVHEQKTTCQRCGTKIKYAYTIANTSNKNRMIVGSECINNFIDDNLMSIEIYGRIKEEVPDYDDLKNDLRQFLTNKKFPHPSSITEKSKGSYKQIVDIERKLRFENINQANGLIRSLIHEVLPAAIESKRRIIEYHNKMAAEEFYCNEEIYDEISNEIEKVRLVEKNDSFITFEIAYKIRSLVFYNSYRDMIEGRLNIKSLLIGRDTSTFVLRGLRVEAKNNQFLKIVDEIIFDKSKDALSKFARMRVRITRRALFLDLENEIYKFHNDGIGFRKISFSFVENEYGEFIERSKMYLDYYEGVIGELFVRDVMSTEKLIDVIEEQIAKTPKTSWKSLNELQVLKESMEANPSRSRVDFDETVNEE